MTRPKRRHVPSKLELLSKLPHCMRDLRPRLPDATRIDLAVVNATNLDDIARGVGTLNTLWDWAGSSFTYSRIAELAGNEAGQREMCEQLKLVTTVLERYSSTGQVAFADGEKQIALRGLDVMTELDLIADQLICVEAAIWSDQRLNALRHAWSDQQEAGQVPA